MSRQQQLRLTSKECQMRMSRGVPMLCERCMYKGEPVEKALLQIGEEIVRRPRRNRNSRQYTVYYHKRCWDEMQY